MTVLSRVLVVEDDVLLLLDLIDSLADHGIEAVPVTSADAAAPLLVTERIDALITDIELPGTLNGLQLARVSANIRPDLPVVVVSGGIRPKAADLAATAAFVPKPYGINQILAGLERHRHQQAA
jgi:DNA-binding NtrC family response regulator